MGAAANIGHNAVAGVEAINHDVHAGVLNGLKRRDAERVHRAPHPGVG